MWNWIKNLFSGLLRAFRAFINAAIPVATQMIIATLKDVAVRIVTNISYENITNEEKRAKAIKLLKEYATNKGIELRDSLAAVIVELAYQYFKVN